MRGLGRKRRVAYIATLAALLMAGLPTAHGQTLTITSVFQTGCTTGAFGMMMTRSGMPSNTIIRTVARTSDGYYMNESVNSLGDSAADDWFLFDTFSYGPLTPRITWPIPANTPIQIDFTFENPKGTVIGTPQTLIVASCNSGKILYSGPTSSATALPPRPVVAVPTLSWGGLLGLPALLLAAFAWRRMRTV